jgi:hypothetical protein
MDRLGPTLIIVGIVVLIFLAMWWGWRRRGRRDAGLVAPTTIPASGARGDVRATVDAFYVATTKHDEPMERLAIAGMAFRGRGTAEVSGAGVLLDVTGERDVFLTAESIDDVGQATWAIDRVVEKDGLVRIAWRIDASTVVDSYLRVIDPERLAPFIDAVSSLIAAAHPTESEA